jgi:hypothetical protein
MDLRQINFGIEIETVKRTRERVACAVQSFEGTLRAGKVKAYIQLVLAVAAKALNGRAASSRKRRFNPQPRGEGRLPPRRLDRSRPGGCPRPRHF